MDDIDGGGRPRAGGGLSVAGTGLRSLLVELLKFINQERLTVPVLAEKIGLKESRVRAILYPDPGTAKGLNLEEVSKVAKFARAYAGELEDHRRGEYIIGYCNEIAKRIHAHLEMAGLGITETALVTNLKLDDRAQQDFSARHAGVYALIRLDLHGHILISRMDVHPREMQLCRFTTDKQGLALSEPQVEGYIYSIGREIQALGRASNASPLRTSILHSRGPATSKHGSDMIGLRLGISDSDGGPFAYRIYCRWIAGVDLLDQDLPEWADLFGVRRHGQAEGLEALIPDVRDILKLFEEQDPFTPWGVRMPTGLREEASS